MHSYTFGFHSVFFPLVIQVKVIDFFVQSTVHPDDRENVIDHGDMRTSEPDTCQQYNEACNRLNCPYGISRSYVPDDRCERCECDDPCRGHPCLDDAQCSVDITPDPQLGTAFTPICRQGSLFSIATHTSTCITNMSNFV